MAYHGKHMLITRAQLTIKDKKKWIAGKMCQTQFIGLAFGDGKDSTLSEMVMTWEWVIPLGLPHGPIFSLDGVE